MLLYLIYTFFSKQRFYKQQQAEIGEKVSKSYTKPESELLLFENNLLSSFPLPSKSNIAYSKNVQNSKRVYFNEIISIIMKMKMKKDHIDTV